jgi:glutamate/tyrosine decarboxylase-like PLP-dependent enzyme
MAPAGPRPRFFGFVIGGSLPVTLAANWLAGAWDQNTGLYAPTPATARLEQVTLRWLLELFGLPSECGGAFVTGATMANFSALAAARHAVLQKAGWNGELRNFSLGIKWQISHCLRRPAKSERGSIFAIKPLQCGPRMSTCREESRL